MSAAPKQAPDTRGGDPPKWVKPPVALKQFVPPERRTLALAYKFLTTGDWGNATIGDRRDAEALIREAREK